MGCLLIHTNAYYLVININLGTNLHRLINLLLLLLMLLIVLILLICQDLQNVSKPYFSDCPHFLNM